MTAAASATTTRVRVRGGDVERVASLLEQCGADAVSIELPPGACAEGEPTVTAWFACAAAGERALAALAAVAGACARRDLVADADWVSHVQRSVRPVDIAGRLVVRASWHPPPAAGRPELVLDPGLAFGTGSHPTTRLILEWLAREAPVAGARVVDYGTGSGILGLAALRLGAREAVGVDSDPTAVAVAADNARRNGLAARFTSLGTDRPVPGDAGVVLANILLGPLLELAPRLAALLAPGGRIALAGVTAAQVPALLAVWQRWLELATVTSLEGWSMVVMHRR